MTRIARAYNILVVEDNPGDAHLMREAFRECDPLSNLRFAETLPIARQLLDLHSFDLVLSDMGVGSGESAEFIRGIRSDDRLKTLPIIIVSGSPDPRGAYEAGANAFISKTMDMDHFFSKIRGLMHFWTQVAELPRPR